mmetsp:Transcript_26790/g.83919  ORF Transcript_26790/g.83919 Transcript_26790/m.83919 type:complete len:416 (-) Transcript_26790:721-1968(-)
MALAAAEEGDAHIDHEERRAPEDTGLVDSHVLQREPVAPERPGYGIAVEEANGRRVEQRQRQVVLQRLLQKAREEVRQAEDKHARRTLQEPLQRRPLVLHGLEPLRQVARLRVGRCDAVQQVIGLALIGHALAGCEPELEDVLTGRHQGDAAGAAVRAGSAAAAGALLILLQAVKEGVLVHARARARQVQNVLLGAAVPRHEQQRALVQRVLRAAAVPRHARHVGLGQAHAHAAQPRPRPIARYGRGEQLWPLAAAVVRVGEHAVEVLGVGNRRLVDGHDDLSGLEELRHRRHGIHVAHDRAGLGSIERPGRRARERKHRRRERRKDEVVEGAGTVDAQLRLAGQHVHHLLDGHEGPRDGRAGHKHAYSPQLESFEDGRQAVPRLVHGQRDEERNQPRERRLGVALRAGQVRQEL